MDLERDVLVVAGKEGRMRKDERFRGLWNVSDVLRKTMCIISGNTVLVSAHIRFEGRRYRTYQRRTGHVKTAKICRILRHAEPLTDSQRAAFPLIRAQIHAEPILTGLQVAPPPGPNKLNSLTPTP